MKHMCHHCGVQVHTRLNCFKFHALKRLTLCVAKKVKKKRPKGAQAKGDSEGHLIGDVMEILKNISLYLASFILRFESYVGCTPPSKALT